LKHDSDFIQINQSGKLLKKLETSERVIIEEPYSIAQSTNNKKKE
jgi:hypothetical protein